jgi:hypothetical protein
VGDTSAGDEDVEPPEGLVRNRGQRLAIRRVAHVHLTPDCAAPGRRDLPGDRLGPRAVAVGHEHRGTSRGKLRGDLAPDSVRAAGDDRRLATQAAPHRAAPSYERASSLRITKTGQ